MEFDSLSWIGLFSPVSMWVVMTIASIRYLKA
jgi:hypothetical protein